MLKRMSIFIGAVVVLLLATAIVLAQESTEVPSSFNDNRINGDVQLGGLAIYCEDQSGNTDGNTFQGGAITVWGSDGQKYITLTADQLRGDEEVPQPPPTPSPDMTAEPTAEPTEEATLAPDETPEVEPPVLLARADTPNGVIWFFRITDGTFAIQGNEPSTGKLFTYTWTDCGLGNIQTDTVPFTLLMEETEEATAEATASS